MSEEDYQKSSLTAQCSKESKFSTPIIFSYEEHMRAIHYVAQNPAAFQAVMELRGKASTEGTSGPSPSSIGIQQLEYSPSRPEYHSECQAEIITEAGYSPRRSDYQTIQRPSTSPRPSSSGTCIQASRRERASVKVRMGGQGRERTSLLASKAHILSYMRKKSLAKEPKSLAGPLHKRDPQLYCLYHHDIGHDTEDCRQLGKEIARQIELGHLQQFHDPRLNLRSRADLDDPRGGRQSERQL